MRDSVKNLAAFVCLTVLFPLACILSFFSFWFRADSWEEVRVATLVNLILIGPLWAVIAFGCMRLLRVGGIRGSIVGAIVTYLLVVFCHSEWTASVLRTRLGPTPSAAMIEQQLYLVQAIVNYRAENGMLPYSFKDLAPTYVSEAPTSDRVRWRQGKLWYGYHVIYRFDKNEGWEGASLPIVAPTRPELKGETLTRARLKAYDRRIATDPGNEAHYRHRIAYLLSLDRRAEALATCKAASRALPDHWRPRLGLAALADPADRASAERKCHAWLEKHPAFIRYCNLARYYRDRGRPAEAIGALRIAAKHPLEDVEDGWDFVPNAYAFDAAKFAYEQREYELVLDLTRAWSQVRGTYSNPGDDVYIFRAAAELALGRVEDARRSIDSVWPRDRHGGLWAQNLEQLHHAATIGDETFVYDPGNHVSLNAWKLFPPPDDGQ